MTDHYYSKQPAVKSERQVIEESLKGKRLRFATDAGVFSKGGVDFGSKLLVETIELPLGAKVLDVGCGYGTIGLSLAAADPTCHITMIDVNERAVELSRHNAELNRIHNVKVQWSDLFEQVSEREFDAVVTNPPIRAGKETVHRIFGEAYTRLRDGGSLWIVIQKKQGAPSAFAKLESIYQHVEEVDKEKGYRIIRAVKSPT